MGKAKGGILSQSSPGVCYHSERVKEAWLAWGHRKRVRIKFIHLQTFYELLHISRADITEAAVAAVLTLLLLLQPVAKEI